VEKAEAEDWREKEEIESVDITAKNLDTEAPEVAESVRQHNHIVK
jgi:hypothetical protein